MDAPNYSFLVFSIYDYMYYVISTGIIILFWLRIRNQPLHPDTAEYLHPGLINALHQKYKPCRSPHIWKWWHGSIIEVVVKFIKTTWTKNTERVPSDFQTIYGSVYCDIDPRNPLLEGSNPIVHHKMAVYWMFQIYGRYFIKYVTSFRIVQSIVVWGIAFVVYKTFFLLTNPWIALICGVLLLLILTYPFIDNGQIHSEIYGTLFISIIYLLLVKASHHVTLDMPATEFVAGFLLIILVVFFKITFAPEALIFLTQPFFTSYQGGSVFLMLSGEMSAALCIVLGFATTHYFIDFMRSLRPKTLLRYREKILSKHTTKSDDEKVFQRQKSEIPWFYFHFNTLFNIGIVVFPLSGFCLNWNLNHTLLNMNSFVLLWSVVALFSLKFQNKFYASHFMPPLIPIVLYVGLTGHKIIDFWRRGESICFFHYPLIIFASVLIVAFMGMVVWFWMRFVVYTKNSNCFILPYYKRKNAHILQLITAPVIGNFIRNNSDTSNRILAFGYASSVYIYAQRRASLEFLECPLTTDPEIANSVWDDSWKFWVCRDIHKFKPKYLVDMDGRLNIEAVNESTGLVYKHEKTFYGCFDIFVLQADNAPQRFYGLESVYNLVLETSERYERRLLYNKELFGTPMNEFKNLKGPLGDLISSWQKAVDG